ncbi:MAG TPA: DUF262 domain-containing protein, partial [Myxococcota bacterium]|nr:DUF262 domain-containing protein [Myxococcota bacterium]
MTDLARIQPAYVKTPTVQLLPDLLEELRTGALRIPPFQREFVWSQEQRLHLLDSVRRGLPTGSLMVWRTTRHLPHDPRLGPFRIDAPEASSFQYLLDGQQRLTTLFAALGAGLWTRRELSVPLQDGASTADDESAWQANFNLETEEFSVGDASPPEDGPALPLALILDDYAYDEWRAKQNLTRTHTNRAAALRAAFQSYPVAVVPLATDDITTVTLTFKRVNASGTPMSELHMARALSWNEGFDLTDHLDRVATALEPQGWGGLEREVILSVIAATSGLDPMSYDVEALAEKLRESTSVSDEDAGQPAPIDAATQALEQAIATFRELGFAGPSIVPSQRAVVLAAVALHEVLRDKRPLDEARRVMRSWLAQVLLG